MLGTKEPGSTRLDIVSFHLMTSSPQSSCAAPAKKYSNGFRRKNNGRTPQIRKEFENEESAFFLHSGDQFLFHFCSSLTPTSRLVLKRGLIWRTTRSTRMVSGVTSSSETSATQPRESTDLKARHPFMVVPGNAEVFTSAGHRALSYSRTSIRN